MCFVFCELWVVQCAMCCVSVLFVDQVCIVPDVFKGWLCCASSQFSCSPDDLLTPNDEDPVAAVTTAPLLGEKTERMIELKLLKKEAHEVSLLATTSNNLNNQAAIIQ